jgi:hypothetical protein
MKHVSEMTVRRLDAGYVVTWLEDGEPCGSETISEKLAYALTIADGGISGVNDDRPTEQHGGSPDER